jgi:hypothetical protein
VDLRDGLECSSNKECHSGKCLKGRCCSTPGCVECNPYGTCSLCRDGFTLDPDSEMCTKPGSFICPKKASRCMKPGNENDRCCWHCDLPCRGGLECVATGPYNGRCQQISGGF